MANEVERHADPIMEEQLSDEEHDFATTSPYITRTIGVYIGESRTKYTLLEAIVNQYPGLKERLNSDDSIILDTVDENIGHTLIHFIYTGCYQILGSGVALAERKAATEFKRSVLAYCAARLCGIAKLEEFTKGKIEELQKELSVFDLQRILEEVSTKLPQDDDWFSIRIQKWIRARLMADGTLLTDERLLNVVGRSTLFDKAVVKSLMDMCNEKVANIEHPLLNGDHTSLESELTLGSSKAASIADSAVHMQEIRQESPTVPTVEPVPEDVAKSEISNIEASQAQYNMGAIPHRLKGTPATETTPGLAAEVQLEKNSDAPVEEPLETLGQSKEKLEDLPRAQSLPAATDSDGEVAKAKPAKKGKKSKKKKKGETGIAPQTVDEMVE